MPKPLVTIENWGVVQDVISRGFEELHPGNRLTGYVLGHSNLPSTKRIFTSPIMSVDLSERVVETVNSIYQLGKISDEYKSWTAKRKAAA